MEHSNTIFLYVGCGNHRMPGFTHAEINPAKQFKGGGNVGRPEILCDISENIPLKDGSVSLIFSRATLEHLTYPELLRHFVECNRLLKDKDGFIRMVVPDLDKMIRDYNNKIFKPAPEVDPNLPCEDYTELFISRLLYHDHYYLHNEHTLTKALEKCGFGEVTVCMPGETKVSLVSEALFDAEKDRQDDDIIIEAKKLSGANLSVTKVEYPTNLILKILAKYFNIRITRYRARKPVFPSLHWFREKIQSRSITVVDASASREQTDEA